MADKQKPPRVNMRKLDEAILEARRDIDEARDRRNRLVNLKYAMDRRDYETAKKNFYFGSFTED